jgi:hypothetical protein
LQKTSRYPNLGGFKISILAYQSREDFEEVKEMAVNAARQSMASI